jgi:hypothetical protein
MVMFAYLRHMTAIAVAGLLLAAVTVSQATDLGAWRPFSRSTELVTLGMSKAVVHQKAGPPQVTGLGTLDIDDLPLSDTWLYIRSGPLASIARLTFSGDRLINIDVQLTP